MKDTVPCKECHGKGHFVLPKCKRCKKSMTDQDSEYCDPCDQILYKEDCEKKKKNRPKTFKQVLKILKRHGVYKLDLWISTYQNTHDAPLGQETNWQNGKQLDAIQGGIRSENGLTDTDGDLKIWWLHTSGGHTLNGRYDGHFHIWKDDLPEVFDELMKLGEKPQAQIELENLNKNIEAKAAAYKTQLLEEYNDKFNDLREQIEQTSRNRQEKIKSLATINLTIAPRW